MNSKFQTNENLSRNRNEIVYEHFLSLFDVYSISWHKNDSKFEDLKSRSNFVRKRLKISFSVPPDREMLIEREAITKAISYKRSVNIQICETQGIELNGEPLSLKLQLSSSAKSKAIGLENWNETTLDIDQMDNESDQEFHIIITISGSEDEHYVYESEINGYTGYEKWLSFDLGENLIGVKVSLEWLIKPEVCEQNLANPQVIAQNFSAVLLLLGYQYWKLFRTTFQTLAFHQDFRVRQSIVRSLPEIAFVISRQEKVNHLLPVFETLLRSEDFAIDTNLLHNFVIFYDNLDKSLHLKIFKKLEQLWSQQRVELKILIAKKIDVSIYDIKEIKDFLIPIVYELLSNKRSDEKLLTPALKLYSLCLKQLFPENFILNDDYSQFYENQWHVLNSLITRFAKSDSNRVQHIFIRICDKLLADNSLPQLIYEKVLETHYQRVDQIIRNDSKLTQH